MIDSRLSFAVEVRRRGVLLARAPASVTTCVEDALFRGVLSGRIRNDGTVPSFTVTPTWGPAGAPAVAGLTLVHDGEPAGCYGLGVFAPKARALIRDLLLNQTLTNQDLIDWGVIATEQPAAPARRFRAQATRAPYALRPGRVPHAAPGTLAVSVETHVLDALRKIVVASPTIEIAGLLVGHLVHDRARRAAALTVTGQIAVPAGRGGASSTHFDFGPNSFSAARQTLAGAADGTICGWAHSHPACERCPSNPQCTADTVFFSPDDVQVHASAFPAAYMVALVAGKFAARAATDPGFRLYKWEGGTIAEHPLPAAAPVAAAAHVADHLGAVC